jgi:hypothetical protein
LRNFRWGREGGTICPGGAGDLPVNTMRQTGGWECGIHTVMNGWAIALDLPITAVLAQRNQAFLGHAVTLINLAVKGMLDSRTIEAFFKCYGLVQPGGQVDASRHFDRTVTLRNDSEINRRIQQVRLEAELNVLRQTDPSIVDLETLLTAAGTDLSGTSLFTAQDLVNTYDQLNAVGALTGVLDVATSPTSDERVAMGAYGYTLAQVRQAAQLERAFTNTPRSSRQTSPTPAGVDTGGMLAAVTGVSPTLNDADPELQEALRQSIEQAEAEQTSQTLTCGAAGDVVKVATEAGNSGSNSEAATATSMQASGLLNSASLDDDNDSLFNGDIAMDTTIAAAEGEDTGNDDGIHDDGDNDSLSDGNITLDTTNAEDN